MYSKLVWEHIVTHFVALHSANVRPRNISCIHGNAEGLGSAPCLIFISLASSVSNFARCVAIERVTKPLLLLLLLLLLLYQTGQYSSVKPNDTKHQTTYPNT